MKHLTWSILLAAFLSSAAAAQTGPLQLLVAFPAGAGTDVNARIFAETLRDVLGRPVVVINRGGASGTIGSRAVANAAPDGNTLGFLTSVPITLQPHLMKLDMAPDDFTPLCKITELPTTLVASPKSGFTTLAQMIDAAHQKPGALNLGVPGLHSGPHMAGIQFMKEAKLDLLVVPHQSDNNAVLPLMQGNIDLAFAAPTFGPVNGFKVLAVSSSARIAALPDVPTFTELGYPVVNTVSLGLIGPKSMPAEMTAKFEAACKTVVDDPTFRQRMSGANVPITYAPGAEFKEQLNDEWSSMKAAAAEVEAK